MKRINLQPKDTYTATMFALRKGGVTPAMFALFVLFKAKPAFVKGKRKSLYYHHQDLMDLLVLYHQEKGRILELPQDQTV